MAEDPLFILAMIASLAVVVILMLGISGFAKGGMAARKRSNRYMRYRIIAQAIAVILIMVFVAYRGAGG